MLDAIGVAERRGAVRVDSRAPARPRDCSTCPSRCAPSTSCVVTSRACSTATESCAERLSFLGGGCWPHYVPAVCDEIVNRGEFLTAYYGDTYGDHGKMQALFEYASMLGELVECDAVSQPTYDWGAAAATSICMAARLTGRELALVPASVGAERRSLIEGYCEPWVELADDPVRPEHRAARPRPDPGGAVGRRSRASTSRCPASSGAIETQAAADRRAGARRRAR